jgi:hypothetical protein
MRGKYVMNSPPGEKPSERWKGYVSVTVPKSETGIVRGSISTRFPLGIESSSTSQRFEGKGNAQNSGTIGSQWSGID